MHIKSDIAELYIRPPKVPLNASLITDARYFVEVKLVDGRVFAGYVEAPSSKNLDTGFVSITLNNYGSIITIEGYCVND